LQDGTTTQCSIVFKNNGDILLASGIPTGTVLATYAGAVTANNTWYHFEFEVVINNTTGSFKVRKNGNSVDDHSTTGINTRGGTANNYANKLQIWMQAAVSSQQIDDLFWRSDASSVAWLGDIRCFTRMPVSDASVTWSRTPTGVLTQTAPASAPSSMTVNASTKSVYTQFTAAYGGTVTVVGVSLTNASDGTQMKCAIFADNGSGRPGAILASSSSGIITPITGTNNFAFTGVTIVKGTNYWVGAVTNATGGTWTAASSGSAIGATAPSSVAAFPVDNPVVTTPAQAVGMVWTYSATPANWQAVSEAQQDATTSYVYSSTVNDADLYGIASIASTPATVIATTVRAYMQKSDAGTRTAAVQIKSGSTTVASSTLTLTTSGWQWAWRTDTTDPATGTAWTAAAVNNAQIGPKVIA
jgi:hypothetical protein